VSDIVEYEEWTDEGAADDQQHVRRMVKKDLLLLQEGDNYWRFMPPLKGRKPFTVIHRHYIDDPVSKDRDVLSINCPRSIDPSARCPIDEHKAMLESTGNPVDIKAADRIRPVVRVFGCAVDEGAGPPQELMPQTCELPQRVYQDMLELRRSPQGGDFTHPRHGFALLIRRDGTGSKTRYGTPGPALEGRTPIKNPNWLRQIKAPDKYTMLPSEEDMRDAMDLLRSTMAPRAGHVARNVTPAHAALPQQPAQTVQMQPAAPPAYAAQPAPMPSYVQQAMTPPRAQEELDAYESDAEYAPVPGVPGEDWG
jgi:hypothetical protein